MPETEAEATPIRVHRESNTGEPLAVTAPTEYVIQNYNFVLAQARDKLEPSEGKRLKITTNMNDEQVLFVPPGVELMGGIEASAEDADAQ